MTDDAIEASRRQFGANAANYATSAVHAKGASLGRIVEMLVEAGGMAPGWQALDIATAAGHVAFAVAPHVGEVVGTDITPEMLEVATAAAVERGAGNVRFEPADAHALPYDDASFDLVTCRIAPHHFSDPATFVAEAARVLRPGGLFGLVDNVAPDDPAAARWCDDFERRRDPSHLRCLPIVEWLSLLMKQPFDDIVFEAMGKQMDFEAWADNMSVADDVRAELLADLAAAPAAAAEWLRPSLDEPPHFILTEGLFTARRT